MLLMLEATPSPAADLDSPWVVSPGIEGFIAFMVLAIAAWLLAASMIRHVRKANFRAAEREAELYGPEPGSGPAPEEARRGSGAPE